MLPVKNLGDFWQAGLLDFIPSYVSHVNLKRRATTRHHPSGAIIYYNSSYDEKTIRMLIAHELGHIVNKELLENGEDSEQTANLFAYIAMDDKNDFYKEGSDRFKSTSDVQILNDLVNICPVS